MAGKRGRPAGSTKKKEPVSFNPGFSVDAVAREFEQEDEAEFPQIGNEKDSYTEKDRIPGTCQATDFTSIKYVPQSYDKIATTQQLLIAILRNKNKFEDYCVDQAIRATEAIYDHFS